MTLHLQYTHQPPGPQLRIWRVIEAKALLDQGLKSSLPSWEHRCKLPGKTRDFCSPKLEKTLFIVAYFTKIDQI